MRNINYSFLADRPPTRVTARRFVLTVLFTLVASTQMGVDSRFGQSVNTFLSQGLAAGGARGILIGVALGTITTGLRILMGFDRPYGG